MHANGTHNFHLPLPIELHERLRREAERSAKSATALAREALEDWLTQRRQQRLHDDIASYAAENAGTEVDLDPVLEDEASAFLRQESAA